MKAILPILLFVMIACSPSEESKLIPISSYSGPKSTELKALINENEVIQEDLAEAIIFQGATNQQVGNFKNFLVRSRRAMIQLLDNVKNQKALNDLEKLVYDASNEPMQVRDEAYTKNYIQDLIETVKAIYKIQKRKPVYFVILALDFPFNKQNSDFLIFENEEGAATFRKSTRGDYIETTDSRGKNGKSTVITPVFELENVAHSISFEYLVRFYPEAAREKKLINFYIGKNNEDTSKIDWREIDMPVAPDAANWSQITISDFIPFDGDVTGKVRIKVDYTADLENKFHPALNIFRIRIKER